ncbi:aldehyde dehydrogenase family protein [Paractinoplanes atraurantiacus]|uniref:Succinate-semialdehyde dehydrogenase / glutarate-semialdehyde dehydrogenase n=1 Tax=Paractinoplanes atraurantiacus TaxID=1036182 RepID=A0A285JZ35_9ACTN|nr:aldehyde dehydrogenase family protein [Actinoplanes atraurantiacus]SNY65550.1 succinate-semialdehyde dehydrogenase / glutarate-semialdehyde dehydrogenase [Actinoplanes atraurantiacus]
MAVVTCDPATGQPLASYPADDWHRIDEALGLASEAAAVWASTPLVQRLFLLRSAGELLTERRDRYAELITAEMGKPLAEALAEIDKCALNCQVVASQAPQWLADHDVVSGAARSWLSYEPLGVVFAVMPWNYPFWQVLRFACAALAAGNAAVLKHAPNVTGCALAIEALFAEAGAPDGLFRSLVIAEADVPSLTARIVADDRIAAVTLTGSEQAGSAVAAAAGAALKKSVLELGGSDPFVVLDDADLPAAATAAARSRFGNAGQSCIAAKRFIVAAPVADEFVRLLLDEVAALPPLGPMARADLRDALHGQVTRTLGQGAVLLTGGAPVDGPGFFYPPTVLDHVEPGMAAFAEETFGPVAVVVRARDDEHAIALANDTAFGLGAAVWSRSSRGLAVGRRIRSGALFVNAIVASDPRLPFGGVGRSGYGRELSAEGTREFTNVRTVYLGPGGQNGHRPRLDHVGLTVGDLDAMTDWYCSSLGLRTEFEFSLPDVDFRGVMLRGDGHRIELLHRAGNTGGVPAGNPVEAALTRGFGHLALDVVDVDEAYTKLLKAGATDRMTPRPSPEPGIRMAYVADPEGNLIELLDRRAVR